MTSLVFRCEFRNAVANASCVPLYELWSGKFALYGRQPLSAPVAEMKPAVVSPGHAAFVGVFPSARPT